MAEADLRTVLATAPAQKHYQFGVHTLEQSCDILRKYVWVSSMQGQAIYMYDLLSAGWFGSAKNRSTGVSNSSL